MNLVSQIGVTDCNSPSCKLVDQSHLPKPFPLFLIDVGWQKFYEFVHRANRSNEVIVFGLILFSENATVVIAAVPVTAAVAVIVAVVVAAVAGTSLARSQNK